VAVVSSLAEVEMKESQEVSMLQTQSWLCGMQQWWKKYSE
jgi:hypothetical protein